MLGNVLSEYEVEDKKQVAEFDPSAWIEDEEEVKKEVFTRRHFVTDSRRYSNSQVKWHIDTMIHITIINLHIYT